MIPKRFAVYGTLRDDDDSGAEWTQKFLIDLSSAQSGKIRGLKMFHKRLPNENWPYALETNNNDDYICVRILTFPDNIWDNKLIEADKIELYNPESPETSWYQRKIVNVELDNGNIIDAIVYYIPKLDEQCEYYHISSGNWQERDRTFISQ